MNRDINTQTEHSIYLCMTEDSSLITVNVTANKNGTDDIKDVISRVIQEAFSDNNFITSQSKHIEIDIENKTFTTKFREGVIRESVDTDAPTKVKILHIAQKKPPSSIKKVQRN